MSRKIAPPPPGSHVHNQSTAKNKEGLTYTEWLAASGNPGNLHRLPVDHLRGAWREGQDPTEWKHQSELYMTDVCHALIHDHKMSKGEALSLVNKNAGRIARDQSKHGIAPSTLARKLALNLPE